MKSTKHIRRPTDSLRPMPLLYLGLAIIFLLVGVSPRSLANSTAIPAGRYLTVNSQPLPWQTNLLQQTIQVHFPMDVTNLEEALNYLLRYSGYELVNSRKQTADLKILLKKKLPLVDREFGPMTLQQALVTLAGPGFHVEVDSLNRTINFQVIPGFDSSNSEKNS